MSPGPREPIMAMATRMLGMLSWMSASPMITSSMYFRKPDSPE